MKISIAGLSEGSVHFEGAVPAKDLQLDTDQFVQSLSAVRYFLDAELVGDEVLIRGKVEMDARAECSCCAEFFSTTYADSAFLRAYQLSELSGESVDMNPELRDAIILKIPNYPVCRDGCKGLCPVCGKNLNAGRCDCSAPEGDLRWGALDGLDT